jgi:hypothetical protein
MTAVAPGWDLRTGGNSNSSSKEIQPNSQDSWKQQEAEENCIYSRGAWLYRKAGWRGVLPLPL